MEIKEFLKTQRGNILNKWRQPELFPMVYCKDGFHVSIQASPTHYCYPREMRDDGEYEELELGFPSERDKLIIPFIIEDDMEPTNGTYGFVPINTVEELIQKHGGIDYDKVKSSPSYELKGEQ